MAEPSSNEEEGQDSRARRIRSGGSEANIDAESRNTQRPVCLDHGESPMFIFFYQPPILLKEPLFSPAL